MNVQLNPEDPKDAIDIIHILSRKMPTTMENAEMFSVALSTLKSVVESDSKKKATPVKTSPSKGT